MIKYSVLFRKDNKLYGNSVFAKSYEEAEVIGKLLYGDDCKVDHRIIAELDADENFDERNKKFYDNDGNEISEDLWN